jgi:hypothetical protein
VIEVCPKVSIPVLSSFDSPDRLLVTKITYGYVKSFTRNKEPMTHTLVSWIFDLHSSGLTPGTLMRSACEWFVEQSKHWM